MMPCEKHEDIEKLRNDVNEIKVTYAVMSKSVEDFSNNVKYLATSVSSFTKQLSTIEGERKVEAENNRKVIETLDRIAEKVAKSEGANIQNKFSIPLFITVLVFLLGTIATLIIKL